VRILVIGGAGFLGSHCSAALSSRGHEVIVFDRPGVVLGARHRGIRGHLEGDICNRKDLDRALDGIQAVIHFAWTTVPGSSMRSPRYDVETNLVGTLHVLEASVAAGVRRVLFPSSGGTIYGIPQQLPIPEDHPTNPRCSYGILKMTVEKYLEMFRQERGLEYTVLRISNAYGEGQPLERAQGAVGVFLSRVLNGETIEIWGNGEVSRDYIHASDIAEAFALAVEGADTLHTYNVGTGEGTTLNTLIELIGKTTGKKPSVVYKASRPFDIQDNRLACDRIRKAFGWSPRVSLREGIARTWEAMLAS